MSELSQQMTLADLMRQRQQMTHQPQQESRRTLADLMRGGLMGVTTDVLGAPVDLATLMMRPFGYQHPKPVGGSDWLAGNLTRPTGSPEETGARMLSGLLSPDPSDLLKLAVIFGGVPLKKLPLDPSAYKVVPKGGFGQEIYMGDRLVGTSQKKKGEALADFMSQLEKRLGDAEKRSEAAKRGLVTKEANAKAKAVIDDAFANHSDLITTIHKNKELSFLPAGEDVWSRGRVVHKSPGYGKSPGSEYRVIEINGEPAYARKSNHWGQFHTQDFVDGEQVATNYNWTLPGVTTKYGQQDQFIGYIPLSEFLKNKAR